jgi:hypothetical protein
MKGASRSARPHETSGQASEKSPVAATLRARTPWRSEPFTTPGSGISSNAIATGGGTHTHCCWGGGGGGGGGGSFRPARVAPRPRFSRSFVGDRSVLRRGMGVFETLPLLVPVLKHVFAQLPIHGRRRCGVAPSTRDNANAWCVGAAPGGLVRPRSRICDRGKPAGCLREKRAPDIEANNVFSHWIYDRALVPKALRQSSSTTRSTPGDHGPCLPAVVCRSAAAFAGMDDGCGR